ncbi:MAG: hypothetical protein L0I29_18050 [Hyphomicrobiales bacterium]|nr:hypothetical protein [Hyphomicrobiales bacterium]
MSGSAQGGNPFSGAEIHPGRVFRSVLLTAAALALACPSASAQSAGEPSFAIVSGLSMGDFLNIRATPTPIGSIEARLPNGSGVKNFGCAQYSGYEWCKVTTLTAPQVSGWTPERYLRAASKAEEEALKETAAPSIGASAGAGSVPAWGGRPAMSETAPADLPENLDARIGGDGEAAGSSNDTGNDTGNDKLREALIARYGPLYRAALGQTAAGGTGDAAPATDAPTPVASAAATEADPAPHDGVNGAGIPHPTPRPARPGETPASVEAAEKATGEIPCANAFGQPTSPCRASITRLGPGIADVVVSLPGGNSRTIRFRGGKPDGSDSPEPLQATREGSLNFIRIGKAERFEILDALALGK